MQQPVVSCLPATHPPDRDAGGAGSTPSATAAAQPQPQPVSLDHWQLVRECEREAEAAESDIAAGSKRGLEPRVTTSAGQGGDCASAGELCRWICESFDGESTTEMRLPALKFRGQT